MEFGLLFLAEKIGTPICLNDYKQIKDLDIKVGFSIQLTYLHYYDWFREAKQY